MLTQHSHLLLFIGRKVSLSLTLCVWYNDATPQDDHRLFWSIGTICWPWKWRTVLRRMEVGRGGICPCLQCRRQCKIFACGVNFSIFTHFFVFFLTKTVEIRWNWWCKIFSPKIWRCKFLDKLHVCLGQPWNNLEATLKRRWDNFGTTLRQL